MKMHSSRWIIYALTDPRTSEVRYVGVTTMTVGMRLTRHLGEAKRGNPGYKNNWVRQLQGEGLRPQTSILEEGDGEGWAAAEQHWIAHFRQAGARLTNIADGGEAPFGCKRSEATKAKMREIGKTRDPEKMRRFQEAGAAAMLKHRKTPEEIEKSAKFHRGRKRSEATLVKIREVSRKVDDAGVVDILTSDKSTKELAAKYAVSVDTIWKIKHRKTHAARRLA